MSRFSFGLENGKLFLKLGNEENNYYNYTNVIPTKLKLNDADWYTLRIWSNNKGTGYELVQSESWYFLINLATYPLIIFHKVLSCLYNEIKK